MISPSYVEVYCMEKSWLLGKSKDATRLCYVAKGIEGNGNTSKFKAIWYRVSARMVESQLDGFRTICLETYCLWGFPLFVGRDETDGGNGMMWLGFDAWKEFLNQKQEEDNSKNHNAENQCLSFAVLQIIKEEEWLVKVLTKLRLEEDARRLSLSFPRFKSKIFRF